MSRNVKTGFPSIDKTHLEGIDKKKLNPTILPMSIFGTFMMINSKRLYEPAVQDAERIYTKEQVKNDSIVLMKALKTYGITSDQKLAIVTPNCYEGIIMTVAANAIGVKVMYFNPLATDEEIIDDINRYCPQHLFVYDRDENFVKKICTEASCLLTTVINLESGKIPRPHYFSETSATFCYVSFEIFKMAGDVDTKKVTGSIFLHLFSKKISLYLQTSGSTSGRPKGLPFTNECIFASMIYASNSTGTKTNDVNVGKVMCILPYRLPYGWMTMFINLMGGNCVVLAPGATATDIGNYYKFEPSYIYGTPVILRAFMDNTPEDADLSFLKAFFCSGFSVSESWYKECEAFLEKHKAFDAEIRNNYGIGEALCVGTASDGIPHSKGTVGKFYIGPEWLLVDDNLNEVRYKEHGEALLRSKSLCKGYYADPELTDKTFIKLNGKKYYRSGDFMSLDENGIVTFYGRIKRFYQPLGATDKVNCETIEKALIDCEFVKTAAVIVVADDKKVQTSKAFVVLNDAFFDRCAIEKDIRKSISKTLLDYQMPGYIVFVNEIPVMKSGKIDYTALQQM